MSSSQQRSTVGTSYGEDSDHWMMDYDESMGGTVLNAENLHSDRTVHLHFFNDFEDLFNDNDLD